MRYEAYDYQYITQHNQLIIRQDASPPVMQARGSSGRLSYTICTTHIPDSPATGAVSVYFSIRALSHSMFWSLASGVRDGLSHSATYGHATNTREWKLRDPDRVMVESGFSS